MNKRAYIVVILDEYDNPDNMSVFAKLEEASSVQEAAEQACKDYRDREVARLGKEYISHRDLLVGKKIEAMLDHTHWRFRVLVFNLDGSYTET